MLQETLVPTDTKHERAADSLTLENLSLRLDGKPILHGLNMAFQEGQVHAIVGPNGAGKSTLAFTIMGMAGYRDVQGDIRFEGRSIQDLSVDERARRGITLGWQEPARFEGLPVSRLIQICDKRTDDELARRMLRIVGLDPDRYLRRAVDKTLSGGERKRIELASILAMKPRLVLLDEPDSGIDVEALLNISHAIALLKSVGTTVILITHSKEVLAWAERAFLLCHGKVVDEGPVGKISKYFENRCVPCDHQNMPDFDKGLPQWASSNSSTRRTSIPPRRTRTLRTW